MSNTLTVTGSLDGELLKFEKIEAQILQLREYAGLNARQDYERTRIAIRALVSFRTAIEKTRKTLKADALEFGRRVDAIAKKHTQSIEEIEGPLQASKDAVDEAKERIKREKDEAERRQVEAQARKKWEAEQARLNDERLAEAARHKEERDRLLAEQSRLKAEREAYEAEVRAKEAAQREAERKAREAVEDAARKIQATKDEEFNRLKEAEAARFKAENKAKRLKALEELERLNERLEAANAKRIKDEQAALEAKLLAEAEEKRVEALLPDKEKLQAYVFRLKTVEQPPMSTLDGEKALKLVLAQIDGICTWVEMWEGKR